LDPQELSSNEDSGVQWVNQNIILHKILNEIQNGFYK